MKKNGFKTHQQGMTLVEIMIALTMGAFLLTGVVQVFSGSKQTYRMQDNLSRMQENARFAMEFISRDIRMADYWGCIDATDIESKLNDDNDGIEPDYDNFSIGLSGANNNADNSDSIVDGTDSITLRGMSSSNVQVDNQPTNVNASFTVSNDNDLSAGDIIIVSNCTSGDLLQITGKTAETVNFDNIIHNTAGGSPGNNSQNLEVGPEANAGGPSDNLYDPGGNVATLAITDYQIRISDGAPGLSRSINGGNFQSLVSDIENMQILYGEDVTPIGNLDGTPDYYVDSATVVNMDNVVSVRVSLLIRSTDDNLTMTPRAYTYNGVSTIPTDRRLRRVFTSTVVLRNRLK